MPGLENCPRGHAPGDAPGASPGDGPRVHLKLRSFATDLSFPPGTDILRTREPEALADVPGAVAAALAAPIGTVPFVDLCRIKLARAAEAVAEAPSAAPATSAAAPSVVVVVSDNTRPAPYRGVSGILWPLVEFILTAGFPPESVTLLVATGTHRVLSDEEIWALFDERVRQAGVRVRCHDAADRKGLTHVGRSARGVEVFMDRVYVEASFRILTGLVEPHLMAGVSGGRKSICPGLLNVESVREFHGPVTLADPRATDLVLEGNPCHEVALEIARMARPDFILNATMRQDGRVVGVFAGDMEEAHLAAVEHVRSFAQIPLEREYDVVVTHGGLVGVNHYQAEKAGEVAAKAVKDGGYLVVVADTVDPDPVGTESYRWLLRLLADIGPEAFIQRIQEKDWGFVHDQWGVQVWARLLAKVPPEHVFYFSPQTAPEDYPLLPSVDPAPLLADLRGLGAGEMAARFVRAAVARATVEAEAALGRNPAIAYLADGPHGIPVVSADPGSTADKLPRGGHP
jgi:nickel-dependent lactate racemase